MRTVLGAFLAVLVTFAAFVAVPAVAEERVTLGNGRLFTNDAMGDGQDRWRSGAYSMSWMRGPEGTATRPDAFGELLEFRFSNRILAPANLVSPAAGDRRYAGIVTAGVFTHFQSEAFEVSLGAELVAVGPSTGVYDFQSRAHRVFGIPGPSAGVGATQFADAVYPALSLEVGRSLDLGNGATLRPFVQMRGGDETYLRAGVDLYIGGYYSTGVTVRDETTGQLYQTLKKGVPEGLSFLVGADVTKVFASNWLPAPAYTRTTFHPRLRLGGHYQAKSFGVFYGLTYTGREFTAQPEGQLLGSLQIQFRF